MPEPVNPNLAHEQKFESFLNSLYQATVRIGPHYFQLPVAEMENPVYRERVYCYELYHRLREVIPDNFGYQLDGELDKSGHPLIRDTVGSVKPDFLVHERGRMDKNLVAMEVKPVNFQDDGLEKDLQTLCDFVLKAKYFRAISLIYGYRPQKVKRAISKATSIVVGLPKGSFYLLVHSQPETMVETVLRI